MLLLQISYVYQTQTKTSNNEYTEDEPIPKSNLSQKRSVVEEGYFLIATIYLGLRLHNQNQNVKHFILESTPPWIPESIDMTTLIPLPEAADFLRQSIRGKKKALLDFFP